MHGITNASDVQTGRIHFPIIPWRQGWNYIEYEVFHKRAAARQQAEIDCTTALIPLYAQLDAIDDLYFQLMDDYSKGRISDKEKDVYTHAYYHYMYTHHSDPDVARNVAILISAEDVQDLIARHEAVKRTQIKLHA